MGKIICTKIPIYPQIYLLWWMHYIQTRLEKEVRENFRTELNGRKNLTPMPDVTDPKDDSGSV